MSLIISMSIGAAIGIVVGMWCEYNNTHSRVTLWAYVKGMVS